MENRPKYLNIWRAIPHLDIKKKLVFQGFFTFWTLIDIKQNLPQPTFRKVPHLWMRAASRQQETHLGNLHAEAIKNLRLSIVLLLYLYAYVYLDMRWYYICTWGSAGLRRGFWHIIKNAGLLSHEYICTSILLNLHTRNMIDYNHPEGQIAYETSIESKQKSMTNLRDPCNLKKKIGKKKVKIKCELHQDFFSSPGHLLAPPAAAAVSQLPAARPAGAASRPLHHRARPDLALFSMGKTWKKWGSNDVNRLLSPWKNGGFMGILSWFNEFNHQKHSECGVFCHQNIGCNNV